MTSVTVEPSCGGVTVCRLTMTSLALLVTVSLVDRDVSELNTSLTGPLDGALLPEAGLDEGAGVTVIVADAGILDTVVVVSELLRVA